MGLRRHSTTLDERRYTYGELVAHAKEIEIPEADVDVFDRIMDALWWDDLRRLQKAGVTVKSDPWLDSGRDLLADNIRDAIEAMPSDGNHYRIACTEAMPIEQRKRLCKLAMEWVTLKPGLNVHFEYHWARGVYASWMKRRGEQLPISAGDMVKLKKRCAMLFKGLVVVESGGDDNMMTPDGRCGPLLMPVAYVETCNRYVGEVRWRVQDRFDRARCLEMFTAMVRKDSDFTLKVPSVRRIISKFRLSCGSHSHTRGREYCRYRREVTKAAGLGVPSRPLRRSEVGE